MSGRARRMACIAFRPTAICSENPGALSRVQSQIRRSIPESSVHRRIADTLFDLPQSAWAAISMNGPRISGARIAAIQLVCRDVAATAAFYRAAFGCTSSSRQI